MDAFEKRELSIISDCILQLDASGELSIKKLLSTCEVEVTRDKLQKLKRSDFKGKISTKILRKELKEYLCPFDRLREGKEVYAKVELPENEEELHNNVVSISLITPSMLKTDLDYFSGSNPVLNIIYTPYSYRFVTSSPCGANSNFSYFKQIQKLVGKVNGGDASLWFRGMLYDHKKGICGNSPLYGMVEYTEGKPISREAYLCLLEGDLPEEITSFYDVDSVLSGYNFIASEQAINDLFNPVDKYKEDDHSTGVGDSPKSLYRVKIYNTGQGNCIYISPFPSRSRLYKKRFFFDIGESMCDVSSSDDFKRSEVTSGVAYASSCIPDFIILSHWHKDHYKLAFRSRQFKICPWIAPEIEKRDNIDVNMTRLIKDLCAKHLLHFVRSNYANKRVCTNSTFSLWRGKKDPCVDDPNADCLLLQMSQTLLPGDCTYPYWPDHFAEGQTFQHLIVPHHGSKFKDPQTGSKASSLLACVQAALDQTGRVYVCAGEDRVYHPDDLHMNLLDKHLCTTSTGSGWKANSHIRSTKDMTDPFVEWDDK